MDNRVLSARLINIYRHVKIPCMLGYLMEYFCFPLRFLFFLGATKWAPASGRCVESERTAMRKLQRRLLQFNWNPPIFPQRPSDFLPHFAGNSSVAKTFLPRQLFALCLVYEYLQRPFSALLAHFPGPCPHPEFIGIEGSSTGSDHRTKPLLCTWKNICCNLK